MENPVRRGKTWWQYDDREDSWLEWKGAREGWKENDLGQTRFLPPPSRWRLEGVSGSEPFYIPLPLPADHSSRIPTSDLFASTVAGSLFGSFTWLL